MQNHGEKPESEKSGSGNAAKSESQEKKSQGEPTGSLNKEQKGTSGGDTADGGEPTKAEINESIGKEMVRILGYEDDAVDQRECDFRKRMPPRLRKRPKNKEPSDGIALIMK